MPAPRAVRIKTDDGWQDIALVGPPGPKGDKGDAGDAGTFETYVQPTQPASTNDGALWIDTDDAPPVYSGTIGWTTVDLVDATSQVVISGIDGDADYAYEVALFGTCNPTTAARNLGLLPNGLGPAGQNYRSECHGYYRDGSPVTVEASAIDDRGFVIARTVWAVNSTHMLMGRMVIYTRTGQDRLATCDYTAHESSTTTRVSTGMCSTVWPNSATKITSFTFDSPVAFTGRLMWKSF